MSNHVEFRRKMRRLTVSAFVLDGTAAVGLIAMTTFDGGLMTPVDGFVLVALLLVFFSALGSILIATPAPQPAVLHGTRMPERRRLDRRVIDLGNPAGIERRSGRDRRAADLALTGVLAGRPVFSGYQIHA